jgi:general secretion pathway protein I
MRRACGGFSLLEILVAFVILGLALGVLMRIFSSAMNNVGIAEGYAEAVLIAESRLATVGASVPLVDGETTGETPTGYRWRIAVSRDGAEDSARGGIGQLFGLYHVDVTVSWDAPAGKARQVRLASLRTGAGE